MVWGCGCPSVVVIGNRVFGFTCKCIVWGCGCPSVVVLGNCALLYLSHCIQTGIKSPQVLSTSCLQGFPWQNKREIFSLDANKCQVLQKSSPSTSIVIDSLYPRSLYQFICYVVFVDKVILQKINYLWVFGNERMRLVALIQWIMSRSLIKLTPALLLVILQ